MDEFPFSESVQCSSQMSADRNIPADLQRLHANLESRLKPFWASALSSRWVEVSVFVHSLNPQTHPQSLDPQLLFRKELPTGPDGFFSDTFMIDWKDICAHIAFDETHVEHELLVEAQVVGVEYVSPLHQRPTNSIRIPITDSTVRVISDIDDTVKMSRVPDGARAIFHNVFVKDLEETIIPEMGDWYDNMWKRGVRFHYVVSLLHAEPFYQQAHLATVEFSIRASPSDQSIHQNLKPSSGLNSAALLRWAVPLQRSSISAVNKEKSECHRGAGPLPRFELHPRWGLGRTGFGIVCFAGCRPATSDYRCIYTGRLRGWPR
jgi:hypothetical protein